MDRPAERKISGVRLSEHLMCFEDTCKAYAVQTGREAALIDFGDGSILDRLKDFGIDRVTDVLMTHHHRDQGQGLARAAACGARIWVPETERDLFEGVDAHWEGREFFNNYNVRQDRFSLFEPVPIAGTLRDYAEIEIGGYRFTVLPTPGHTTGSISLLVEVDGRKIAFTGDLIARPGQVWSLAATQWTYNGAEGVAYSIASLASLKKTSRDLLLPSHGEWMDHPADAIDRLAAGLYELLECRGQYPWLQARIEKPYLAVTPHLLINQTSIANSYVLLSRNGKALLIDYGYDFTPGFAAGADRAARRPWLYSLDNLKSRFGVTQIEVVIPTHYHDDHVAGINLLRRIEQASVWAPVNVTDILTKPAEYDLPCLWYEPIPVDRTLPMDIPIRWQEYELTLHPLPGHTQFAAAIQFEVDGKRMLATGDQYQGGDGPLLNYVYQNRFRSIDYCYSAELYRRLKPDLLLTGHWGPLEITPEYLSLLARQGHALEKCHQNLLVEETRGQIAEGFGARIQPYQARAAVGEMVEFEIQVRNPYPFATEADVRLVLPMGWENPYAATHFRIGPQAVARIAYPVAIPQEPSVRQARIGADITIDGRRFGQMAEAIVWIEHSPRGSK